MNTAKRVTIGLCVKDSEATIQKTIQSVIGQDFPQKLMEVIIVDGYSQDRTLAIIKDALSQTDLDIEIFEDNEGLGQARQIIVDNARGDYILWVDGDNKLNRDFIKEHVQFMDQNPKIAIAVGYHLFSTEENWIAFLEIIEDMIDFNDFRRVTDRPLGTGGSAYRVEALRQVGGFDRRIKGAGEDVDVEYKLRAIGWKFGVSVNAKFHEKSPESWQGLFKKYRWYGSGGHYNLHMGFFDRPKIFPPLIVFVVLSRAILAYQLTLRKICFLLPLHYFFKRTAWLIGFIKAHLRGYGHRL